MTRILDDAVDVAVADADVHEHRRLLEGDLVLVGEILDDAVDGLDRGGNARLQRFLLGFFPPCASFRDSALEEHVVILRARGSCHGFFTSFTSDGGRVGVGDSEG